MLSGFAPESNIKNFKEGDIIIGPTPVNKMRLRGSIFGVDEVMSRLFFHVKEIVSVPKIPIKEVAGEAVHISPYATLEDASKILMVKGVKAALVDEQPPSLIS